MVALTAATGTFTAAGSAAAAPDDELKVLRVLNWNIAGGVVNPFDSSKPDNEGTMEVVDRLLQFADDRDPHLVSMNEACSAQADHAREGLEERFGSAEMNFAPSDTDWNSDWVCVTGGGGARESGNALIAVGADSIIDRSAYYITPEATITSTPQDRGAACMTVSFQSTLGQTVRACSMHLDPDDDLAGRQAEAFADFMTADGLDLPLVLAGDFNTPPDKLPGLYIPLQGGGGQFVEADHPRNTPTYYKNGPKIDYVFADHQNFGPPNGLVATVIDGGECLAQIIDHPCSDHSAYYALLPFKDTGSEPPTDIGGPVVSAGPDVEGDEGTPIMLEGSVQDDSDATTARWTVETIDAPAGARCTLAHPASPRSTITCTDQGTFEVTLTVTDGVHPPVSDKARVTTRNAAPVLSLNGPKNWELFRAGTPVQLDAPFTDTGANDTHTCVVDWDSGDPEEYAGTSRSCSRAHTFAAAGMYTIKVTVRDDEGASDSAEVMVVVYDPEGGRTNADGSVASPAGAWSKAPELTGQQWFNLTAEYERPTATRPKGPGKTWLADTPFYIDSGDRGLDWLVVTPDGKTAAKGTALNRGVQYRFVLYGYDGCANGGSSSCRPGADAFRAVVWPTDSGQNPGSEITYDNRRGAGYDVDVADLQPLTSGQVLLQP